MNKINVKVLQYDAKANTNTVLVREIVCENFLDLNDIVRGLTLLYPAKQFFIRLDVVVY